MCYDQNGSFYLQPTVSNPETGARKNNYILLNEATNRTQAINARYDVLKGLRRGKQPSAPEEANRRLEANPSLSPPGGIG